MNLTIHRNGTPLHTVEIDDLTIYTHEVMGVHEIRVEFIAMEAIDLKVDDYITFRGERYTLNVPCQVEKRSNFAYHYTASFESAAYWMKDKIFRHLEAVEFSYTGTAAEFVALAVSNMNEIDTGWEVGTVEATEIKTIQFVGEERGFTVKGALMKFAEEFGLEFWLTNKTINLTRQAGVDTNLDFEYGRGRGLYSVTRGTLENPLYNRIYGYGGTKNIAYTYRNGAKRLVFEERGLERPLAPGERRRETSVIFDDIYPERTSTFTAVSADWLELTDPTIDFDINAQLIEGEEAKVVFKSGELAGKEFNIEKYDHASKKIKIIPFVEEDGYTTPNSTFEAKAGDQYMLIGIDLPQSYITAAEARLKAETIRVFNTLSRPPYDVVVDPHYIRTNGVRVNAGDRVRLRDKDLGIDDMIRVTSVSFPLVEPDNLTLVISDSIRYTNEVIQEINKNKVKTDIVTVDRTKAELARRNMVNMRRLQGLIYDPDGYFDPGNIKPGSIETGMLAVGAKSQNYGLNGVTIEANYQANPNSLRVSGGSLIHFEIEIEGLGYVWAMTSQVFNTLVPGNSYYLYAKCSKTALTGTWFISTTPYQTEQEPGYYHFWVGILYPVTDGYRGFQFTKGMTFIVGDTITTGRITSQDGLTFFDLSQGTFKIGDSDSGMDWGVTDVGQLTINGALVTKLAFAENAEIINLIAKNLKTSATGQRMEILEGENKLKFYNAAGNLVLTIDDSIDADQAGQALAGIRAEHGLQVSYLSGNGLFSNAGGYSFLPAHLGWETNASVVGILAAAGKNTDTNGISAGVVGIDNSEAGNSKSYGGYFNTTFVGGLNVQAVRISANYSMNKADTLVSCYNTEAITIDLPADPYPGRMVMIRKNNDQQVTVSGNGKSILNDTTPMASTDILGHSYLAVLLYDGQYWLLNAIPRQ